MLKCPKIVEMVSEGFQMGFRGGLTPLVSNFKAFGGFSGFQKVSKRFQALFCSSVQKSRKGCPEMVSEGFSEGSETVGGFRWVSEGSETVGGFRAGFRGGFRGV